MFDFSLQALGSSPSPVQNPRRSAYEGRLDAMNRDNKSAANALKSMLVRQRFESDLPEDFLFLVDR